MFGTIRFYMTVTLIRHFPQHKQVWTNFPASGVAPLTPLVAYLPVGREQLKSRQTKSKLDHKTCGTRAPKGFKNNLIHLNAVVEDEKMSHLHRTVYR